MRSCPNARCRAMHEDHIGQCPDCGAPMNRTPDKPMDPNMHLYGLQAQAQSQRSLDRQVFGGGEVSTSHNTDIMEESRRTASEVLLGVPYEA